MLKKLLSVMVLSMLLTGCNKAPVEHNHYVIQGRYYIEHICEDANGDLWEYSAPTISNIAVYDKMPVYICLDDMGTPDNTDDEILGLVYDRETAIYDKLEAVLSESFEVEREGNNIRIDVK